MDQTLWNILTTLGIVMAACVMIALIGLFMLMRRIRRLHIPQEADFFTTMRHIPLSLVIMLDLLDFGLDIFSAPIVWIVLDRMGLPNLRNKAVVEALIPFTNVIPTFTAGWLAARALKLGNTPWMDPYDRFDERTPRPLPRRRPRIIDMDDR
jgi:hypothetical protein